MNTAFWIYRGKDAAGHEIGGIVESPNKDDAMGLLKNKGVRIHSIKFRDSLERVQSVVNSKQLGNGLLTLIILGSLLALALVMNLETYRLSGMMAPPRGAETMGVVSAITAEQRRVAYTFQVNGQEYHGRERISDNHNPLPQINQSITVYYANENPTVNCLYPKNPVWSGCVSLLLFFLIGVCLAGFLMLGSRDNLCVLYFLLRSRQSVLWKELASVSGMAALFLFFPFATASARFAWVCAKDNGIFPSAACSTVILFVSIAITGMLAGMVIIALFAERAYRTRLVSESYVDWREGWVKAQSRQDTETERYQSPRKKAVGTLVGGLVWSGISAVGFLTFGLPVLLHFPLWLSDSWEPIPCIILSSEKVHGVGFRYGPTTTIAYQYSFGGQPYTSNEYKLGLNRAELPADTYHAGQTTTCYVNPKWPGHPVLKIAETWDAVQWMVIAVIFTIWQGIGLVIVAKICMSLVLSPQRTTKELPRC